MAWKWFPVTSYKVSVGAERYYGIIQLRGNGFYGSLSFSKAPPSTPANAPVVAGGQRFYGALDFQQMSIAVDMLRNEKPVRFGWYEEDPSKFHLMSGFEPVGEEEGDPSGVTP